MPTADATWLVPPDAHPVVTAEPHHRYRTDYGKAATACTCDGQSTCCWCNDCPGCAECETDIEQLED